MDASAWIQAIANGFALGWMYVLIALGLTLILSIMGILQLAHGEVYMIGAYVTYFLCVSLGVNLYVSMALSMIVMAVFGIILEKFLFRPAQRQVLPPIVISLGLTLILMSFAVTTFGLKEKSIPRLAEGSLMFFDSAVPKDRIIAVGFAVALLILVYLFLKRTKYGQAMIASAQSPEGALLRGINPNRMSSLAMAIGCALAAAGGTLAGSILMLNPSMGTFPLMKGLVIIVLGGMGSLLGAAVGGIILGLIDGILPVAFEPGIASVAPFIIVIIILLVKPQGLFGHE
ncbi:MAG: branched-chain amino acid ABC transporter permease [Dehalococcoidales bacterium]|nr:branched-chain amino acid ABC transporter permease [Dehalococcoidales bacterium]